MSESKKSCEPVNYVGVRIKGLTPLFKQQCPAKLIFYEQACREGSVRPGHPLIFGLEFAAIGQGSKNTPLGRPAFRRSSRLSCSARSWCLLGSCPPLILPARLAPFNNPSMWLPRHGGHNNCSTPRSVSSSDTVLLVICAPRSACSISCFYCTAPLRSRQRSRQAMMVKRRDFL
jgi:hypothetical protein